MSKEIPLTNGQVTTVDDEFYDMLVAAGPWSFDPDGYPMTSVKEADGRSTTRRMHQVIMCDVLEIECQTIDHRNRDGLDNQLHNLRPATRSQNQFNAGRRRDNTSGFKGVHRTSQSTCRPWVARIRVNGREIHIGYFPTPQEAADAYDEAALKYHGEFACTNAQLQAG